MGMGVLLGWGSGLWGWGLWVGVGCGIWGWGLWVEVGLWVIGLGALGWDEVVGYRAGGSGLGWGCGL